MSGLMLILRILSLAFFLITCHGEASSQGTAPIPTKGETPSERKDPRAISLIDAAIGAYRGAANLSALTDCLTRGTYSDGTRSGTFIWHDAGWEFRDDWKPEGSGSDGSTLLSGHGKGRLESNDRRLLLPSLGRANHLPFANLGSRLLQLESRKNVIIKLGTECSLLGAAVTSVRIYFSGPFNTRRDTLEVWYFDSASHLPLAVDFLDSDLAHTGSSQALRVVLTRYEGLIGIAVPKKIHLSTTDGQTPVDYEITQIDFNQAPSSATFDQK